MQVTLPKVQITSTKALITLEQFKKIVPQYKSPELVINNLNDTLYKYQINTPLRISHFLAQVLHESGNLEYNRENLNYSKEGLLKTFSKYFNNTTAGQYARQPIRIANKVYANRMGNGNEASGDGWKYRGTGPIQLTGKSNFTLLSRDTGIDFVSNPDLLVTPDYLFLGAGWYWNITRLNSKADANNLDAVSDLINIGRLTPKVGDAIGYSDRLAKFNKIYAILK